MYMRVYSVEARVSVYIHNNLIRGAQWLEFQFLNDGCDRRAGD